MRDRFALKVALVSLALSACAAPLSSFQPAHVGPQGTVRAEMGMDVTVPTGSLASTIDAGKTLAQAARTRTLSDDEKVQLFAAGLNLALSPPGFVEHIRVSYNPLADWEIALRYASETWRLGGRHQLLHQDENGVDLSVGVGVSRFSFGFPLEDVIDIIKLDDFSRVALDVPVMVGGHGDFYRWWSGPRFAVSRYGAELVLHTPGTAGSAARDDIARTEGHDTYVGLTGGGAFGYRYLFLAVELTWGRLIGDATLDVFGRTTKADTSSWMFSPGIALAGEF